MSTPEGRGAWLADMRKVLDAIEAHPTLPRPYSSAEGVEFFLLDTISHIGSPRRLSEVEGILAGALGVTFAARKGDENKTAESNYYLLEAHLENGTPLTVKAWADSVAERRVTGTRTVEDIEWVRLPAEDPAGAADDEEPQS